MKKEQFITFVFILLAVTSCKKDQPLPPEIISAHQFVQVSNLKIDPEIVAKAPEAKYDPNGLWYYSLEEGKVIAADQSKTDNWDFAFDCYKTMIYINNGKFRSNKVISGSAGKALFTIVPKLFEEVTSAPADDELYNRAVDYSGNYGESLYSLNGDLNPDILGWVQSFENGVLLKVVKAIKNRTIIFKTNKGKYAKLQIRSVYKDNPEQPTESSEKFYLNFRFFLQKDGSTNLDSSK